MEMTVLLSAQLSFTSPANAPTPDLPNALHQAPRLAPPSKQSRRLLLLLRYRAADIRPGYPGLDNTTSAVAAWGRREAPRCG
jgi:hypothetical protein